MDNLHELHP